MGGIGYQGIYYAWISIVTNNATSRRALTYNGCRTCIDFCHPRLYLFISARNKIRVVASYSFNGTSIDEQWSRIIVKLRCALGGNAI